MRYTCPTLTIDTVKVILEKLRGKIDKADYERLEASLEASFEPATLRRFPDKNLYKHLTHNLPIYSRIINSLTHKDVKTDILPF